jgi:hypothetical protein
LGPHAASLRRRDARIDRSALAFNRWSMMNRWMLLLIPLSLLACTSCGGAASIQSWQNGVERYVQSTGGGDPTVLRDTRLPDGRHGFAALGSPDPRASTDANAILPGHQPISGKPGFIYLVGVVEKFVVKDIRLASLTVENGKYNWTVGKKDDDALKTYRAYNDKLWRSRFPDRKTPPVEYTSFPQSADQFELNVSDGAITATHAASGAQWELPTSQTAR